MHRHAADPGRRREQAGGFDEELGKDGQIADEHHRQVDAREAEARPPAHKADGQQQRQQAEERRRDQHRQPGLEHQREPEQLDRAVEPAVAQDVHLEQALHELGQGALQHHQKSHPVEADGHRHAGVEMRLVQHQQLGRDEGRQHDIEEGIVGKAVLPAMAQQRPQQHGHDGGEEQQVGEPEQQRRPAGAEGHADPLDHPGRHQPDQRPPMPAAHLHPVLGGGEQEAAHHRPAEAEEHLVGMPLERAHRAGRRRQRAGEDQRPQQREGQPGEAGEQKEGAEADEPEGMGGEVHGWAGAVPWKPPHPTPPGSPPP